MRAGVAVAQVLAVVLQEPVAAQVHDIVVAQVLVVVLQEPVAAQVRDIAVVEVFAAVVLQEPVAAQVRDIVVVGAFAAVLQVPADFVQVAFVGFVVPCFVAEVYQQAFAEQVLV